MVRIGLNEIAQLVGRHLLAGGDHADGNRQIEARPFLPHVRRGQVAGPAAKGETEAPIAERVITRSRDSFTAASGRPTITILSCILRMREEAM
jgi:hypothetical protein